MNPYELLSQLVFYVFAALTLLSATAVITVRNSVRAVLFLVLTFFCSAVLWMLLQAEFLALSLIVVYVGAVMVLFLFVVMMLDVEYAALKQGFTRYLPLGVLAAVMMFGLIWWMVKDNEFAVVTQINPDVGTVASLGSIIYTDHFYPFELAAVVLLIAIIAAISLTFRGTRMRKTQDVGRQLLANKEDRLRIVKMPAVKKTEGEQA